MLQRDAGGIAGLAVALQDHWGAVEADFQHYYRLDLRDEVEATAMRRVWALIHWLPPDAALRRAASELDVVETAPKRVSFDDFARRHADHLTN